MCVHIYVTAYMQVSMHMCISMCGGQSLMLHNIVDGLPLYSLRKSLLLNPQLTILANVVIHFAPRIPWLCFLSAVVTDGLPALLCGIEDRNSSPQSCRTCRLSTELSFKPLIIFCRLGIDGK